MIEIQSLVSDLKFLYISHIIFNFQLLTFEYYKNITKILSLYYNMANLLSLLVKCCTINKTMIF